MFQDVLLILEDGVVEQFPGDRAEPHWISEPAIANRAEEGT